MIKKILGIILLLVAVFGTPTMLAIKAGFMGWPLVVALAGVVGGCAAILALVGGGVYLLTA